MLSVEKEINLKILLWNVDFYDKDEYLNAIKMIFRLKLDKIDYLIF